ncbi:hypothetical protein CLV40_10945 [Actinokineospora auranticolor]|uniref:Tetratricopeptide repeat protein n=1 Tax=Actinokineospora auranticolor TaxID=155976 RepID=A0A2S6GN94_9PSEU|nr:hypothetical protein CLV40_10945 [Actinokineospora auranticolor]
MAHYCGEHRALLDELRAERDVGRSASLTRFGRWAAVGNAMLEARFNAAHADFARLAAAYARLGLFEFDNGEFEAATVKELLVRQRESGGAVAIALGLEVRALRSVAGKPMADWAEALVHLARAYAEAGQTARLEDALRWLTRLAKRVPSGLRVEVARLTCHLEGGSA